MDYHKAVKQFVKAANKGVMKVMSKMGVSCTQGYCGAQIFEAIGLNQEVIDKSLAFIKEVSAKAADEPRGKAPK